jgi:hypothetical protein
MRLRHRGAVVPPVVPRCDAALPRLPRRQGGNRAQSGEQTGDAVGQIGIGGGGGQVFLPQFDIAPGEGREIRGVRHDAPYRWYRPIATFGRSSADAAFGRKSTNRHSAAKTAMLVVVFPTDRRESPTR